MAKWTAFPYDAADYTYDAAALKKHWNDFAATFGPNHSVFSTAE